MPLNLSEFVSRVSNDTIKKSRFDVTFNRFPQIKSNNDSGPVNSDTPIFRSDPFDVKNLTIRCASVDIPGLQVMTTDYKLHGGMPVLKIPNSRLYDDVTMTFISSGNLIEKKAFEAWVGKISDLKTNALAYYDDVSRDIEISMYNETSLATSASSTLVEEGMAAVFGAYTPDGGRTSVELTKVYTVQLIRAIPYRVETLPVSWEDTDDIVRFSVIFSYEQLRYMDSGFDNQEKLMI